MDALSLDILKLYFWAKAKHHEHGINIGIVNVM